MLSRQGPTCVTLKRYIQIIAMIKFNKSQFETLSDNFKGLANFECEY